MKKLIINLVMLASFSAVSVKADGLIDAIKAGNVRRTQSLLAQHRYLEHTYKKELAHEARKATKHAKKATESLSNSNPDAFRLLSGLGFSAAGLFLMQRGMRDWSKTGLKLSDVGSGSAKIVAGAAVVLVSVKEAYKGWKLSIAHGYLEEANAIELLIAEKETRHHN
ncbi:hypothetical protein H0X48_04775 [Candidatus Dependentiae bacterium]|nr:hypothetical protein [Candidatus Dependentiae bacterium]